MKIVSLAVALIIAIILIPLNPFVSAQDGDLDAIADLQTRVAALEREVFGEPTATEIPPTEVPPTEVPPTEIPPTEIPPTEVPPTATPTEVPPTATSVPPTPTTVPPTATSTVAPSPTSSANTINVSNATQLQNAFNNAVAGQTIVLADGTYMGRFTITRDGTATKPITVRGTRNAIVRLGTYAHPTIFLNDADYWRFEGFTLKTGKFAFMLEKSSFNVFDNLDISDTGQSGLLWRFNSTDNTLQNSNIYNAGVEFAEFGEGIYIGQNYFTWTNNTPDRSDRNRVINNTFKVRVEAVDVKEGSSDGLVKGNIFDGSMMTTHPDAWYAESWVDIKGNGWIVEDNKGTYLAIYGDGYEVTGSISGWGINNTFRRNEGNGWVQPENRKGRFGVHIPTSVRTQNTVTCDNTFTNFETYSIPTCKAA